MNPEITNFLNCEFRSKYDKSRFLQREKNLLFIFYYNTTAYHTSTLSSFIIVLRILNNPSVTLRSNYQRFKSKLVSIFFLTIFCFKPVSTTLSINFYEFNPKLQNFNNKNDCHKIIQILKMKFFIQILFDK